jgi:hypothetical protein
MCNFSECNLPFCEVACATPKITYATSLVVCLVALSTKDAIILTTQSTTFKTPRYIINLTHVHLGCNLNKHNLKIEKIM